MLRKPGNRLLSIDNALFSMTMSPSGSLDTVSDSILVRPRKDEWHPLNDTKRQGKKENPLNYPTAAREWLIR